MVITTEEFIRLWGEREPRYQEQEAFWNHRAAEFSSHMEDEEHQARVTKLQNWLHQNGALQQPSRILDIGCGPGKYAIPFAQAGHQVVGTDISPEMLKFAQRNAERAGVSEQVQFKHAIWEKLDLESEGWEGAFDLVFASMTPAIRNADALGKMIRCSRGGCYLSSFVYKNDPIATRLRSALGLEKKEGSFIQRSYAIFNLLWLQGYYPAVHYIDSAWENQFTLEEAIEHFRLFLQINPVEGSHLDEVITTTLQTIAQEQGSDQITQKVTTKTAWLYWDVK